jgi:hypothetical protein|tara:strand:- start:128 stop:721 length:594 start_codon:yes stop_codon:yes gene_type:complete
MNQEKVVSDLIAEMASDSGDAPDKIDTLDEDGLSTIARLANEAARLEESVAAQEQLLKEQKKALHVILDEQLPEALESMGLQKFTLTDGAEISVKPIYAASIPVNRREEAFQWLRDHEFGDLVKNNVTVTFGRGEDDIAKEFVGTVHTLGLMPNQTEKVEPMTLKAWLRERVEAGDPIPLDLFGAYISTHATIKRSK